MAATTTPQQPTTATTTTITTTSLQQPPSTTTTAELSPNDRRVSLTSPWAQVVKGGGGGESPESSPPPENIPVTTKGNNVGKNPPPAWKKPVNVVSLDHSSAAAWPALSESTRLRLKSLSSSSSSSSSNSPKHISLPVSQEAFTSHVQQSPRQGSANTNPNSSTNSAAPNKNKSTKRGGGNKQGSYNRGPPPPPQPHPAFPIHEMAQGSFFKAVPGGGVAAHPNFSNEHPNHRSSNRRGNSTHQGRGDGRNNRRDQDHANHNWSSSPNPHGRGGHGHPHRPHGRGFMGPPVQGPLPFIPPPIRPYGNPMVYSDPATVVYYVPTLPVDSFRGMPYITGPPPPPFIDVQEPLHASIVKQIEYYFSDANLVKDGFLRKHMDEQGWVPITLIAGFPRMQDLTQELTDSIPYILDCLRGSTVVEVQGDKVRRCNDWMKWIAPQQSPLDSVTQSAVGSYNDLSTSIQRMSLEETQDNSSSTLMGKELTNNLRVANIEGSIQQVC